MSASERKVSAEDRDAKLSQLFEAEDQLQISQHNCVEWGERAAKELQAGKTEESTESQGISDQWCSLAVEQAKTVSDLLVELADYPGAEEAYNKHKQGLAAQIKERKRQVKEAVRVSTPKEAKKEVARATAEHADSKPFLESLFGIPGRIVRTVSDGIFSLVGLGESQTASQRAVGVSRFLFAAAGLGLGVFAAIKFFPVFFSSAAEGSKAAMGNLKVGLDTAARLGALKGGL